MKKISGLIYFVLFAVLIFSVVIAQNESENGEVYREGKRAFRSCAACHCVTDPKIQEDEDWLKLNEVTLCISAGNATPAVRKALNVFFRSPKSRRPLLVDEKFTPEDGRICGRIEVPSTSGSAYLKADRASIRKGSPAKIRLYWQASEKGKTLSIPVGEYRVISYQFYRRKGENKAERWMMSVTNMNGCKDFSITEGKTVRFDLKAEGKAKLTTEETEDGMKLSLALRNETGSTLTFSKNGTMCIPQFLITDAMGNEVYKGTFKNT